jgi:hypothetical protein
VVRSYDAYWLMSLPFVSVLAVIEIIYQLEGN